MNDDWRLQVDLREEDQARALTKHLDARPLQHDLSEAFHDRVIVTRDGARVFLYAGSREQVERARDAIDADARQHGWQLNVDFRRWHPSAEEWSPTSRYRRTTPPSSPSAKS